MSSRRFKKERHPFAYRSGSSSISNKSVSEEEEEQEQEEQAPKAATSTQKWRPTASAGAASASASAVSASAGSASAWTPEIRTALKLLLSARLCSVVWSHITDCDETFNYWEPLHYFLHKTGFQTWEYSPKFAIRSYLYILLHAFPLKIYEFLFHPDRLVMFYLLRLFFAVASVGIETLFYCSVKRRFGPKISRLVLFFQLFAPAFFISTTAFLPSSFSMYMTTLAFALWFLERDFLAVTAIACSGLLGWPFAGILGFPIAVEIIKRRGLFRFITWTLLVGGSITAILIAVDSEFYGKRVFPTINIVLYNVISGHGPELYGTEPWFFYVFNGFLNFNLAFPLALLCPLVGVASKIFRLSVWDQRAWSFLLGSVVAVAIWFAILFSTPHKEERFLFPVYSLLTLLAATSLELFSRIFFGFFSKFFDPKFVRRFLSASTLIFLTVFALLGTSRMFALSKFYGAPTEIYTKLHLEAANETLQKNEFFLKKNEIFSKKNEILAERNHLVNLCVGKEWYRFPSSFFLPKNWQLQFIQSDFRGILPKPYAPYPQGFSVIPTEMNDENREEPGRYIDVCQCDYLVDLNVEGKNSPLEPEFVKKKNEFSVVFQEKFLDAENSHRIFRAFYIPFFSEKNCKFGDYVLLRRKAKCPAERNV